MFPVKNTRSLEKGDALSKLIFNFSVE